MRIFRFRHFERMREIASPQQALRFLSRLCLLRNDVGRVLGFTVALVYSGVLFPPVHAGGDIFAAIEKQDAARVIELLRGDPKLVHAADEFGRTPLHHAVEKEDLAIVKAIALGGADIEAVDFRQMTPLHLLSWHEFPEHIAFLVSQGAPVEAQDVEGKTPLHVAAGVNNLVAVRELVKRGADLYAIDDNGNTILHEEAGLGVQFNYREDTLKFLVALGAPVNDGNFLGMTPLMVAASQNNVARIRALLDLGGNANQYDWRGMRAYEHAVQNSHKEAAAALKKAMKQ